MWCIESKFVSGSLIPFGILPNRFKTHFTGIGLVSINSALCNSVISLSAFKASFENPVKDNSHIFEIVPGMILAVTDIVPWPPPKRKLHVDRSSPE